MIVSKHLHQSSLQDYHF